MVSTRDVYRVYMSLSLQKTSKRYCSYITAILEMNPELNNVRLKFSQLVHFNMGIKILKVPKCPMFASRLALSYLKYYF